MRKYVLLLLVCFCLLICPPLSGQDLKLPEPILEISNPLINLCRKGIVGKTDKAYEVDTIFAKKEHLYYYLIVHFDYDEFYPRKQTFVFTRKISFDEYATGIVVTVFYDKEGKLLGLIPKELDDK